MTNLGASYNIPCLTSTICHIATFFTLTFTSWVTSRPVSIRLTLASRRANQLKAAVANEWGQLPGMCRSTSGHSTITWSRWCEAYLCPGSVSGIMKILRTYRITRLYSTNIAAAEVWNINICHCNDVIMSAMASQIICISIVCSSVGSTADQRKHRSFASLAFVRGIHRWPVNSPHKRPETQKMLTSSCKIWTWYRRIYEVQVLQLNKNMNSWTVINERSLCNSHPRRRTSTGNVHQGVCQSRSITANP